MSKGILSASIKTLLQALLAISLNSVAGISFSSPFKTSISVIQAYPGDQICSGGSVKNVIPSLNKRCFIDVSSADYRQTVDRIQGIELDRISRACPIAMLNWHEIVNDRIGLHPFAITYCPLCGTGIAFSARVQDKSLNFGVSRPVYNS